uniref:Uncharacterized protein n=1 Tax=Amphimedon queenslandica TaxID=400682 RepID=A0A1X7T0E7_AMPQE
MLRHGEDHPEMSNVDFYIGLLLSNAGHYEESQAYLESALRLQNKFHGSQSITVATMLSSSSCQLIDSHWSIC